MYLTLEVVSPQAASMGAEQRKAVGPKGLTIGRAPDNDWVIPDPYISKQHARITYVNGSYFVEGLGRNPIAIGRSDNTIASNQPRALKNGDRLFIDQYEMLVAIVQGEAPGAAPVRLSDDPFALIAPADKPTPASIIPSSSTGIPDAWDNSVLGSVAEPAELDPLAALGGAAPAVQPELAPVNWQQASPLGDHLDVPQMRTSGPAGIPDNWERSGFTHMDAARPAAAEPVRPAPPPPPRRPAPPQQRAAPPPAPARASPVNTATPARSPPRSDWPVEGERRTPAQQPRRAEPMSSQQPSATNQPRQRAAPPPAAASADLTEFLRGVGLSEREISPEVMSELGKVLRVVIQGVMEVLQARSEIKSQFRLPLTRVKAAENNPLKLSPNVESALHTMLVQRNPGYLGTVAAFEDAFADIRSHQMAMLEGLRAAFESTLASFNPQELEKEFERAVKRSGLLGGLGAKLKFWELYVDRFEQLGRAPDDTFRRLFGDVFAAAYEEQLERLKTLGRHSGKK